MCVSISWNRPAMRILGMKYIQGKSYGVRTVTPSPSVLSAVDKKIKKKSILYWQDQQWKSWNGCWVSICIHCNGADEWKETICTQKGHQDTWTALTPAHSISKFKSSMLILSFCFVSLVLFLHPCRVNLCPHKWKCNKCRRLWKVYSISQQEVWTAWPQTNFWSL